MMKNMNSDFFALTFLSDMSVTPDLGLHYKEKLKEWIAEETNDDDIRDWFNDLGYSLANPNLLDASEDFRSTLAYWNGSYTVAFEGNYVSLQISEERVQFNGAAIRDYKFAEDTLTWGQGELHFCLAMNEKHPALVGKLVHGKYAKDEALPSSENIYGSTVLLHSNGQTGTSNLRNSNLATLDFFNGKYTLYSLVDESTPPSHLIMELKREKGVLLLTAMGPETDYSTFSFPMQAGHNGKWNDNALSFYDAASKNYASIQFIVSMTETSEGKVEQVKGFFGTITKDASQLEVPNVMGVLHPPKAPSLKADMTDHEIAKESYKATIASTVFTGVAFFVAIGVFVWQEVWARKERGDNDDDANDRANKLDQEIESLKNQLESINNKIPETPKLDLDALKRAITRREKTISELSEQIKLSKVRRDELEEEKKTIEGKAESKKKTIALNQNREAIAQVDAFLEQQKSELENNKEELDARREEVKRERIREVREKYRP